MKISEKVLYKIREVIGKVIWKKSKNKLMREKLLNNNFTIISCNCIGGIIYNDLNEKFLSPTINLFFSAEDFIKFCENIESYLRYELKDGGVSNSGGYPIGVLNDIMINFVHYNSFNEAKEKWNERKVRLNYDNLYIIATDRDGCTDEIIKRFSKLKYKKVLFSSKYYSNYDFVKFIPEFQGKEYVGELTRYCDFKGFRYYEKYFDVVEWLNNI